jgi:hypothetical protein
MIREEWTRLRSAVRSLDVQTMVVLCFAAFVVILHYNVGARGVFLRNFGDMVDPTWRTLWSWGWWFGTKGILSFVLPLLVLMIGFGRSAREAGVGLGNWRLASAIAALYLPLVAVGTWVLSDSAAFQDQYPHFKGAARNWHFFLIYEALFLFYWIGWEYVWRGFVLFGTIHKLGLYAIFVQMVPFAVMHAHKPWPEAMLSILGGVALGALCWRCRSFWIAVPIHAAQMMLLDFWCTLRARTDADGWGWSALMDALAALG